VDAFLVLAIFLRAHYLSVIYMLPMAALEILLIFAEAQLSLTLYYIQTCNESYPFMFWAPRWL